MLTMTVTDGTGTHHITTRPWTVTQWELKHKTKLSRVESDGIGMGDYLWMCWRQLSDDGLVTVPFDAWGPTVTDVDLTQAADSQDPTNPAPSHG